MRVLHVIANLGAGGAERLLVEILPRIKRAGLDVAVLLFAKKKSEYSYIRELEDKGIIVDDLNCKNIYIPLISLKLLRYIKRRNFDLIHVHLFPAMYWAAFAKGLGVRPPLVFTEHSIQNKRFKYFFFKPIDRLIYSSYSRIIAVSPAIAQKLSKWTHEPQKITIIRNGVDIKRFQYEVPYKKEYLEEEFKIPQNARTLMMAARFAYPKDHKTVVDALEHLPSNFHLLFAGEGKEQERIKNYVIQKGLEKQVHFLGFRSDVSKLMKSVDINLLSSFYEGMSGVACEALASARPFLGTNVKGINDVIPDYRYLFEVGDEVQLSQKILLLTTNNEYRQKMVEDGLKWVQQYAMDVMINKMISLYENVWSSAKND